MTFSINLYVSFVFLCLGFASLSPFGLGRFSPLRCPRGDLLSVSIPDLVRSLGSTEGWVPCFGGLLVIYFIFFLFFFVVF